MTDEPQQKKKYDESREEYTRSIPQAEDVIIILSWIKRLKRPVRCVSALGGYHAPAAFEINSYEDSEGVKLLLRSGFRSEEVLTEVIWEATKKQQLRGIYQIHDTRYECFECTLRHLMGFLNTTDPSGITHLLNLTLKDEIDLIQHHVLSNPDLGLCLPLPHHTGITTVNALLRWMKTYPAYMLDLRTGEVRKAHDK